MAKSNQRDVTLTLAVETTGTESVDQLAGSVQGVAAAGTAAAPGLTHMSAELAALTERTRELRSVEATAKAEVTQQRTARAELSDALARLRAETDKTTRSTTEYQDKERKLKVELIDSRAAIRAKQETLSSAATAARVAAAAEQTLSAQMQAVGVAARSQAREVETGVARIGSATEGAAGILRQFAPLMAAAFSAQQFIGTITSAESLSRSFEQVFGSAEKARAEMEFIKATANRLGLETLDLARSYQSLAASTKGTVLEGEKTLALEFSLPKTISVKSMAATIEEVMPHLLKPVAT